MVHRVGLFLVLVTGLFLPAPAVGQTQPKAPVKVTTPPGYLRVEVGGRSFITLPADDGWVRRAASEVGRPTPTTQASDIAIRLRSERELLLQMIRGDLPGVDPGKLARLLDEQLAPALARIETIKPAMVYVVSPMEHLKQALQGGWSDARVRYNAAGNQVEYERTVSLQPDGQSDESAVVAIFNPGDAEARRIGALSRYVADTERQVQQQIATRSVIALLDGFRNFLEAEALSALPRGEDQDWFAVGLANVLAARYAAQLHGSPDRQLVLSMLVPPADARFDAGRVDLLRPLSVEQLREDWVQPYLEAKRRKSTAVVYDWLTQAGPGKIAPTLEAIATAKPADGPSLVAVIRSASGVDLSPELSLR